MDNCPDGNKAKLHTHKEFGLDKKQRIYKTWDWWSTAYNCKISVRAADGINGKLIVKITEVENANVFIYMQPNAFGKDLSDTHGILENNMVYQWDKNQGVSGGVYRVPSDWTITITYNIGMFRGSIILETWL